MKPCPSFPCFFLEKGQENHQKTRIFSLPKPLQSLEKKGKNAQKTKEFLEREGKKKQGIPKKNKERKDRVRGP